MKTRLAKLWATLCAYKSPLIHLLFVFHCATVFSLVCPMPNKLTEAMNRRTSSYVMALSMWQIWNMFAPDTWRVNSAIVAYITYEDGGHLTYELPRIERMSRWEQYRYGRLRKWLGDNLLSAERGKLLQEPTARWVLERVKAQDSRPVKEIVLKRRYIPAATIFKDPPSVWRSKLPTMSYPMEDPAPLFTLTLPSTSPQVSP